MVLENEALKIEVDCNCTYYTKHALNVYKYLNCEKFEDFETIELFKPVLELIFKKYNQFPKVIYKKLPVYSPYCYPVKKRVLVAFSGGLDSCAAALKLKEEGWEVNLFHCINANQYENFQAVNCVKEFAKKFNFPLYTAKFSPKFKGKYKKFWSENSYKNFLIYSICYDLAMKLHIGFISSGDDLNLSLKDSVMGVNDGDSKEYTEAFMKSMCINFIPLPKDFDKGQRLMLLYKYDAGDYYYSTTTPGRLVKTLHDKYEKKYNIKLDKYNAGSDRKDCFHCLLLYYYYNYKYPQEFINHCWEKLGDKKSPDYVFFNKNIPLEQRIKNLKNY